MNNDDLFQSFNDSKIKKFKEEAKKRWGTTDAWKQSEIATKNWTNEDFKNESKRGREFTQKLADNMLKGFKSEEFQALVDVHYKSIQKFYDCPLSMYRSLGVLYVTDKRFTKYYDSVKPGLAEFMKDAIDYYCRNLEEKD